MFYFLHKIFQNFSPLERRLFLGASLIFVVSSFFIFINFYYQKTVVKPAFGGTYIEGLVGQPSFINPLIANNDVDNDLIEILFSSLNDLTRKYQISDDHKSWILTLKRGIKWSDGKPITADDVLFTLETIQNPTNNHYLFSTWRGVVVERLNENEVRFSLKTPYVFLIDNFKELKIVPQHIFGSIPASNLRLSHYNLEPVSSGPYKFEKMATRKDGFITDYHLIVNPYYYGDRPFIERIVLKFYGDENQLINAFNKREIDALGGLSNRLISKIKVSHKIITMNLPRYYAIFFNPNTSIALKEKSVRRALSFATNKNKIIKEAFGDHAMIVNGPLPPNIEGYDQSVYKEVAFDLKKANNILDAAGWTINDKNIRMKDIDGVTVALEFDVVTPQIAYLIAIINNIKRDWAKIGVKINPIVLNPSDINSNIIKTRNYQMIIFGNILKKSPDLFSFWHSAERFYPGRNLALYNSKKVDSLLEDIRKDFNKDSRNHKLSQLQKAIDEDKPAIFLFNPNYFYVIPKKLGGFNSYFLATPAKRFENIGFWYLKTARVFQ